ncbi:MAG: 4'-phosphopantetheinyl transferase superfamily protein [Flavobacteriaceae bacterium]
MSGLVYLTQIWTAKEALYKAYKKKGLIFNTQLRIDPFVPESTAGTGWVIEGEQQTSFALEFRIFENYCLTLAT